MSVPVLGSLLLIISVLAAHGQSAAIEVATTIGSSMAPDASTTAVLSTGGPLATAGRLQVMVYYEALCMDSMDFLQLLLPAWRTHKQHIDLRLVPYGKAIQNRNATTGEWLVQCQHGPAECLRNTIHACLLEELDVDRAFELIACSMVNARSSLEKCATEQSIDLAPSTACAASTHGTDLLVQHGQQTSTIQMTFVPSVAIDGQYDWDSLNSWLFNFEPMFCYAYYQKFNARLEGCKYEEDTTPEV